MSRLFVFIVGIVVGAGLIYAALTHHFVRTSSGWQIVPKTSATFDDFYVDVREFDVSNWSEHRELVAAIIKAEKSQILGDAAQSSLEKTAGRFIEGLRK
jgi:hypothetical protein